MAGGTPYGDSCMVATEETHGAEDRTSFVAPGSPTATINI